MTRRTPRIDRVGAGLALAKISILLIGIRSYGYFRDELYYLACADHLAWGYVDHPPLSVAVLRGWRAIFGDSLVAIRLFPALCEAAVVYVATQTARALGARGAFAALAGFATLAAPGLFAFGHYYSMNAIDHLVWALVGWLAVRLAGAPDDHRAWIAERLA